MSTKTVAGKWGNSVGVRLPEAIVQKTNIRAGSLVSVRVVPKGILIEKREENIENLSLDELVARADPKKRHDLIWENMPPVGREVW